MATEWPGAGPRDTRAAASAGEEQDRRLQAAVPSHRAGQQGALPETGRWAGAGGVADSSARSLVRVPKQGSSRGAEFGATP